MNEPVHMSRFEKPLVAGSEWLLTFRKWLVVQLREGVAYGCYGLDYKELPVGSVLISPPNSAVVLRASRLGRAVFQGLAVGVDSLSGFLTAAERQWLESLAPHQCAPYVLLPPSHPLAATLKTVCQDDQSMTLQGRLAFLIQFAESLPRMTKAAAAVEPSPQDTQKQLLDLINRMPESELVGLRLGQVAEHLSCCERHTSRLFRAVCGRSLRVYVSELRLKKACSLLAQGSRKVIDVALESGYGSPAQFNHVFKRRFGMTPTQWRERYQAGRGRAAKGQPRNQPAGIA
ncbi:MAG: helix-turn-helix domain-containing protein [Limisphaerales bacterium]